MKKQVAWFSVLCLLFLLGGCSAGDGSAQADPAFSETSVQNHMAMHEVLTLGNISIVNDGKVVRFHGEGWKYDPATATLTLDGVHITEYTQDGQGLSALYCSGDLNIQISGENTIDLSASKTDISSSAVYVLGHLHISGSGKFTVLGGEAGKDSVGIYALRGFTISGTEVVTSGGSGVRSMGVASDSGLWLEKDASLQTSGGTASQFSAGVYTGQGLVSVQNSAMTAIGGSVILEDTSDKKAEARSCGILSASQVSIHGSSVTANGGDAEAAEGLDAFSDGVYAIGNVEIDASSHLTASGGVARGREAHSRGVCCLSGNVSLRTGTLNGYGREAFGNDLAMSCGVYVKQGGFYAYEDGAEVTLTGGTAEISSEAGKAYANGIHVLTGDISLTAGNAAVGGGRITGAGGSAEGIFSGAPAA